MYKSANRESINHDRSGGPLWDERANATDLCSYRAQLLFDSLVTAVDVVHAIDDGFTIGDQRRNNQRGRGPQIAGQYGGAAERSLAVNHSAAPIDLDIRSHAVEFLSMHIAILENVFGEKAGALGLGCQSHVLRLHIGRETRIFFGDDVGSLERSAAQHAHRV